jgi:hypothetical protein
VSPPPSTLTAFTPQENRHTKIFGTCGQITGGGRHIEIYDFTTDERTVIDAFIRAHHQGQSELLLTGA